MPCPYFYPHAPLPDSGRPLPARMPLGGLYEGDCHAVAEATTEADKDHCNFGYSHGHCAKFPSDAEADAVRFSLRDGRDVLWILEKDFSPVRHGGIHDASSIVRRQAEVFLENYERNIKRTSGPGLHF
ncbi:MAG: hypothetical protein ABI822_08825 [Bryobacteraceae bacterium]